MLVPGVAFGLVHLYQGWKAAAKIVVLAVTFGAIFLLTRSLLVPIVLHVTLDLVGGLTALGMRPPDWGFSLAHSCPGWRQSLAYLFQMGNVG